MPKSTPRIEPFDNAEPATNPFENSDGIMPIGGGEPIPFSREFQEELGTLIDKHLRPNGRCSTRAIVMVLDAVAEELRGAR